MKSISFTNKEIRWRRSFSVLNDEVVFPIGTIVDHHAGNYWISHKASPFVIIRHDLETHGCSVKKEDIATIFMPHDRGAESCDCGHIAISDGLSAGYGSTADGKKFCNTCCGRIDLEELERTGRLTGYFVREVYTCDGRICYKYKFTNWPGTLAIRIEYASQSVNNFGATRWDFWFRLTGHRYWGWCVGNDNQVATVKRLKDKN